MSSTRKPVANRLSPALIPVTNGDGVMVGAWRKIGGHHDGFDYEWIELK